MTTDRWQHYLHESHSESTLMEWARRLRIFRFVRAFGGHANDGDSLTAVFPYGSEDQLVRFLGHLGITPRRYTEQPPVAEPGVGYTIDEYRRFPAIIPGTQWLVQPGHCTILGRPSWVWCEAGAITVGLSTGYDVTAENVDDAEAIEVLLATAPLARVDPPVDSKRCICPQYYPEFFEQA